MPLTHPDFAVARPPGLAEAITDAEWWLWLRLHELEGTSELGGILAWKRGFHSTGKYNAENFSNDYSIRDLINRSGPWWWTKCSALDWTFPEAHNGNYVRIQKYSARLDRSSRDPNDERLDLVLFEWYGQADFDTGVEGWNELRDEFATSDPSHLFHIHLSFLRNKCGDFWGMWALLTVLMGWPVAQWRASLPGAQTLTPQQEDDDMKLIRAGGADGKIAYALVSAFEARVIRREDLGTSSSAQDSAANLFAKLCGQSTAIDADGDGWNALMAQWGIAGHQFVRPPGGGGWVLESRGTPA